MYFFYREKYSWEKNRAKGEKQTQKGTWWSLPSDLIHFQLLPQWFVRGHSWLSIHRIFWQSLRSFQGECDRFLNILFFQVENIRCRRCSSGLRCTRSFFTFTFQWGTIIGKSTILPILALHEDCTHLSFLYIISRHRTSLVWRWYSRNLHASAWSSTARLFHQQNFSPFSGLCTSELRNELQVQAREEKNTSKTTVYFFFSSVENFIARKPSSN